MSECKAWQGGCKDAYAAGWNDAVSKLQEYVELTRQMEQEDIARGEHELAAIMREAGEGWESALRLLGGTP